MRVVVLGAGRVGAAMARDLARDGEFDVEVADASAESLARLAGSGIAAQRTDLRDPDALRRVVREADLVVGAVPGPMGFETARRVLEADRDIVDISFFEEDAFELDAVARARGRMAIVDVGVAPGFSNLVLGRHAAELRSVERFDCIVGGLPVERRWPWEYKAPFSPIDVIAEYTRPARLRRNGVDVVLPALSEVELVDLPGLGTVEAFNTDGVRSLLTSFPDVPHMVEKTLRYPGHAEKMRMLRESGFFGEVERSFGGSVARPLDVTASLLFDDWRYEPGEADLTAMRVGVEGADDSGRVRHEWTLLDHYHAGTDTSSMARTTGYTCTAAVRMVAAGLFREAGVVPPERIGADARCFDFIVERLRERGVDWRHEQSRLPS